VAYDIVEFAKISFDAAIFDLDGVLVNTTPAHSSAWKTVFDDYLRRHGSGYRYRPFDPRGDYLAYVDGRSRKDGVRQFLASRGIHVPEESSDPAEDSITSLALSKDSLVQDALRQGSTVLPGAKALLAALRQCGIRAGVASSSANCQLVLKITGLASLVEVRVDGITAADLGLPGKPEPALFLVAARKLGVLPARCAIFEDALPGVEAGGRGGFGLVVGVDRGGQEAALRRAGAHKVIENLTQVSVQGA